MGCSEGVIESIRKRSGVRIAIICILGEGAFDDFGKFSGDIATRSGLARVRGRDGEVHHHDLGR
jgi:hypothetical protein